MRYSDVTSCKVYMFNIVEFTDHISWALVKCVQSLLGIRLATFIDKVI